MKISTLIFLFLFSPTLFLVDGTVQTLPFSQDWMNNMLISSNDDWSGVPGIIGYRGDGLASTGADPQTILADGTNTPVDVIANQMSTGLPSGGVAEFEIANSTIALQGSGTADAPFILIHLNTTGFENINVAYNVRDIEDSPTDAVQQVALHYRVGNTGDFTNLPGGYIADATEANTATKVTPISVTLPADADDQAEIQVRVMTANASGSDEWVGIDDINVTGDEITAPTACHPVINEVDYDQPGFPDAAEFIEIYNPCDAPVNLAGYTVELVNGSNNMPYGTNVSLPNIDLPVGGFYVICYDDNSSAYCDQVVSTTIQNGPDAISLQFNGAQVDGLSYEGAVGDVTEGSPSGADSGTDGLGLSRFPDGNDTDDNSADFSVSCITPGEANTDASTGCEAAPVCAITAISTSNPTACDDQMTTDPADDTFTADVTVTFENAPMSGTLELSGNGMASAQANGLASPHTFFAVEMPADGSIYSLTASFSTDGGCTLTNGEVGQAPDPCSSGPTACHPVINEVDYDQPGSDDAEFIELYNPCDVPINLAGYALELVNGSNGDTYGGSPIALADVDLPVGGYYVVCFGGNAGAYCNQMVSASIQNGAPDAISLVFGENQVDGLSYEGDNANTAPYVEGTGTSAGDNNSDENIGLSRFPDGNDTDNNSADFSVSCITPGEANTNVATGCVPTPECAIISIMTGDISDCDDQGTPDASDDTFTADVTVTFENAPGTGMLKLSGNGEADVSANGLTSPHTFTDVEMSADGTAISLFAIFTDEEGCSLENLQAGMAPAPCSSAPPCKITEILLGEISACNDNGTPDPSDDFFTANVTVNYMNPPSPGTIELSGDASAVVSVGAGSSSHMFGGVTFAADGGTISLTAKFQEETACTFTNEDLGTAPLSCSLCDISGISLSDMTSCNDNGTANPTDDFFTADVTVDFQNPPSSGVLSLSGSGVGVVPANGLGTSYTFQDVMMDADGNIISLTAEFSENPSCSYTEGEVGEAPNSCSPCGIESIVLTNVSACENQLTLDPADDTFTADVVVTYFQAPASGTLELSGSAVASTGSFSGNSFIFSGLTFSANGAPISLTASFSAQPDCSLTAEAGTAPGPCSDDCFINITDVLVENESCPGAGGSLTILTDGTPGQIGYSVDGGASFQLSEAFSNLSPGVYPIFVQIFGQGCSASTTATVLPAPASALQAWYKDIDGDFHSDGLTVQACEQPEGYQPEAALLTTDGDCNDYDADQFPGQVWYPDNDADGYPAGGPVEQCLRPAGHVSASQITDFTEDCDDDDPTVNPGAEDVCNGIDDNCDGVIDDGQTAGLTYMGSVSFTSQEQVDAWSTCYAVIDGNLTIKGNGLVDLAPLIGLMEVTGNVYIKFTDLTSMAGLDNLTTIGGYLRILKNDELMTLDGLQNVASVGGYLRVYYNRNLIDCCAIHDLLNNGGVGGSVNIFRNETGCDSEDEIYDGCGGGSSLLAPPTGQVGVSQSLGEAQKLVVFPNPTSGVLNVRLTQNFELAHVRLFDLQGRQVFQAELGVGQPSAKIGAGNMAKGMYMLQVIVDGESFTERVVVE